MRPLRQHVIDEVDRLLDAGLSQAQIARRLGVSRRTVQRVSGREQRFRKLGSPVRCKCGLLIDKLPCLQCMIAHQRLTLSPITCPLSASS